MKNYLDSIDRAALRSRAEQMLHTSYRDCSNLLKGQPVSGE